VSERPDVSVSIVNHENRDAVLAGLEALAKDGERSARLELIVVDNASEDGSAAAIRARFPEVELVADGRRRGFGANHNLAMERARGEYGLLLNDDTVVLPGAIDTLAGYLRDHPSVAVAAPRVVDGQGRTQASAWPLPTPARDLLGAVTVGRALGTQSRGTAPRRVGWVLGCALLVRRSAFLDAGAFDEGFFMYSDEIDLCARLAASGLETHWVPSASVVHEGQASTGGHASPERAVEMARSRRRYWQKHYGRGGAAVARAAVGAQFAALAVGSRVLGRPSQAFRLQARETWGRAAQPGLREQADEWNRSRDVTGTPEARSDPDPEERALGAPGRPRPPT
jgi:N-acetylglucosaminyl-diphospho-decaprenol L-rhamnosyltransferase